VHISLHAGELAPGLVPPDGLCCHIRLAFEEAHAERIGHGVDVMYEEKPYNLLKEMASNHVMVEINLTSNDVILGIAGTYGVQLLMRHVLPTTHFQITADWLGKGALIAFCGALCGALYPAWLAARKDPIDALAYE